MLVEAGQARLPADAPELERVPTLVATRMSCCFQPECRRRAVPPGRAAIAMRSSSLGVCLHDQGCLADVAKNADRLGTPTSRTAGAPRGGERFALMGWEAVDLKGGSRAPRWSSLSQLVADANRLAGCNEQVADDEHGPSNVRSAGLVDRDARPDRRASTVGCAAGSWDRGQARVLHVFGSHGPAGAHGNAQRNHDRERRRARSQHHGVPADVCLG